MDYLIFSAMRMRKCHLFCTSSHHNVPYENKSSTRGLSLEISVLARARAQLLNMLYISTHLSVPHGENIQKTVLYMQKLVLTISRAEWMNGICLIRSRGRLISPSLPVGDDKYLNLSSQKRPTGRNLGGNRLVRRSGTTSRGTVVLVFCLRMRRFPLTYHIRENEMNWVASNECMTVSTSFTRASFLNMRADQLSSWLIRTSFPKSTIL